jgi:SAM-dependent methyltransferase
MDEVPLPPRSLMFMSETPEQILQNGNSLLEFVRPYADPQSGIVVDVGCGYGRMAYVLAARGFSGKYLGIDVRKQNIDWMQENFTSRRPNFQFQHVDVHNERYNKVGGASSDSLEIAHQFHDPELILVLSVFTHMYEHDIANYLSKISSIMGKESVLYVTMFLMNDEQRALEDAGKSQYPMRQTINDHCKVWDPQSPLHVIAYDEKWVLDLLATNGLRVLKLFYGKWAGRRGPGVPAQDTFILGRTM